jgi:regulator of cell morphogenesis and NO signaling
MTSTLDTTIRDIVANDYRAAAVFQHYGIDFCCGGNRTIDEASREAGTSADEVLRAVADATATPQAGAPRFNSWDLPLLVNYIVSNHHAFVRESIPTLLAHTKKIADVHGGRHPELTEVARLFLNVADEMTSHMWKEENVLFPYISTLAQGGTPDAPFSTVRNPIRMMEAEHESAGGAMARIREITSGYDVPADACTTYRVCLQELEAFERDLHQHVHLENNILFPKAQRLEAGEM